MSDTGKQSELIDPPMVSAVKPPALVYAPVRRPARRWIVRIATVLFILSAVLLAVRQGPIWWQRAQIWYWQRQCLEYVNPVGTAPQISAWPKCWVNLKRLLDGPTAVVATNTTIFCGAIQNGSGEQRLLIIQPDTPYPSMNCLCYFALIKPDRFGNTTFLERGSSALPFTGFPITLVGYTFASRDSAHPNHLTFSCKFSDHDEIIDCWLTIGDRMLIEPRNRQR